MGFAHSVNHGRPRSRKALASVLLLYTDFPQGVVLSVTSLIMALAQDHLEAFAVCYQKAVDRLNRVSGGHDRDVLLGDRLNAETSWW